jgi:hypothetical protein
MKNDCTHSELFTATDVEILTDEIANIQADIHQIPVIWQRHVNALSKELDKVISKITPTAQAQITVNVQVGFIPMPIFGATVEIRSDRG